jgi:hypothetical protein
VTTGTGSGKTESFLVPILDHCRRARRGGQPGVKAVLLYPMNALATDQTNRINEFLQDPDLSDVTAGLYIGDVAAIEYERVLTKRTEMRRTPPHILITNYKVLDLLLRRQFAQRFSRRVFLHTVIEKDELHDLFHGVAAGLVIRHQDWTRGICVGCAVTARHQPAARCGLSPADRRPGRASPATADRSQPPWKPPRLCRAVHGTPCLASRPYSAPEFVRPAATVEWMRPRVPGLSVPSTELRRIVIPGMVLRLVARLLVSMEHRLHVERRRRNG